MSCKAGFMVRMMDLPVSSAARLLCVLAVVNVGAAKSFCTLAVLVGGVTVTVVVEVAAVEVPPNEKP